MRRHHSVGAYLEPIIYIHKVIAIHLLDWYLTDYSVGPFNGGLVYASCGYK
jgi:hypothetical protein